MIWTKGLNRTAKHNWLDQSYWVGEGDVIACDSYGDKNSNYNDSEFVIQKTGRADDQAGIW